MNALLPHPVVGKHLHQTVSGYDFTTIKEILSEGLKEKLSK